MIDQGNGHVVTLGSVASIFGAPSKFSSIKQLDLMFIYFKNHFYYSPKNLVFRFG
jgi:hypothetical protein